MANRHSRMVITLHDGKDRQEFFVYGIDRDTVKDKNFIRGFITEKGYPVDTTTVETSEPLYDLPTRDTRIVRTFHPNYNPDIF